MSKAKSKPYKTIEEETSVVNEPLVMIKQEGNGVPFVMTAIEKMQRSRAGLSKHDLVKLKLKTNLDYDELSNALSVARATLINKKESQKFNTSVSERILDLFDIYSYGYAVFENEESFNEWMMRPNRALGGLAPFDIIDNQFGREEIKNLIGRIEYGVYS